MEAIVLHSPEDIQSRGSWRDRLQPFQHQVQNLFTFCRRLPVTLLADDVGLGKTISAGLIMSELMVRRRVRRTLILCPKILGPQWVEELDGKFGITAKDVTGEKLTQELTRQTPVLVTTYESARNYLAKVKPQTFDLLILDEAHKLRNLHGTQDPPRIAKVVRTVLEQRLFRFVVMLTATPIHNRLWDIYSLLDCLTVAKGHKNPLGTPEEFKLKYLLPGCNGRQLNPLAADEFRGILKQYLVRTRRSDARLKFPSREVRLFRVDLSAEEQLLKALVAKHIQHLNPLQQISLAQAMMSSPQALAVQMENMAAKGSLPPTSAEEARAFADRIAIPAKLDRLLAFLRELRVSRPDWRVVVFTIRKETQQLIGRALRQNDISFGFIQGGEPRQNQVAIERFREEPPRVHVLVSTDAGAEGINLQVANILINYDLPWNPMIVEQRIGRLQRLASEYAHVVIGNLVAAGSVEERVVCRLLEKLQGIAQAIGDIESILESAGWEGENQANSFENQLRELVVKSLLGHDVEEATRLKLESIERAQREIEERRQEIDSTLGQLDASQQTEPRTPKLSHVPPSISAKDFVLRTKQAEGARVEPRPDGAYEVSLAGRPSEVMAFEEEIAEVLTGGAVFMGNVRLYQPGKPAFERSVQHWVDHCGHLVQDLSPHTPHLAEKLARSWCRLIDGAEFRGFEIVSRQKKFQGRVRVKAKASNGLDSYEKLIWGKFHPERHAPLLLQDRPDDLIKHELQPSNILPAFSDPLMQAVETDRDISAFCRFYEARRQEEIAKAGEDPRRKHKVNADLMPSIVADIVGLQGVSYDEVEVSVQFTLDGNHTYMANLLAVPATEQVLREPSRKTCQMTNRSMPDSCLAVCSVSGLLVLRHLLASSEVSGRRALPRYLDVCQVTGKKALEDELATSAISGRKALASLFRKSPLSDRLGLAEDFARCEITGRDVLQDELVESEVSGKRFARDEAVRSAVSGTVGHRSELIYCRQTGQLILPSEAGESAFSGKLVRKDLLSASDKPPGRLGLAEEFGICAATGKRLLRDEMGQSAVSGKWFDLDLLHPSQCSGKLALEEELVTCAETGARLLPEETSWCTVTRKRVDLRLLGRSEISGLPAMLRELRRCAVTRKLVLPSELEQCQLTQAWVLPVQLGTCAVSGKRVMRSQLVTCEQTGGSVIPSESGKSDYSDKRVRKDLLVASDKPPGRLGLSEEFAVCEVTGKKLLLDELGRSAVSGKLVDRTLLRPSACSKKLALPSEMVTGELSGALLLPAETGRCQLTGKQVDFRLLARSEVSGATALKSRMVRCASTGKLVLPGELEQCGVTGRWVLPGELETCAVTGKRALRSQMLQSDVSGKFVLANRAFRSGISGRVGLPLREEVVRCAWLGTLILRDEAQGCRLTRMLVAKPLLNEKGELKALRELLDGRAAEAQDADDLIPSLQTLGGNAFRGLKRTQVLASPRGRAVAVCGEIRTFLGFKTRYVGFLLKSREQPEIMGHYSIGTRRNGSWILEEQS